MLQTMEAVSGAALWPQNNPTGTLWNWAGTNPTLHLRLLRKQFSRQHGFYINLRPGQTDGAWRISPSLKLSFILVNEKFHTLPLSLPTGRVIAHSELHAHTFLMQGVSNVCQRLHYYARLQE